MKEEDKLPWYKRIANMIIEVQTFDVSTNTDGLRTVAQMIATKLCEDMSLGEKMFGDGPKMVLNLVKTNLPHAIQYLMDEKGIPVYRMLEPRYETTTEGGAVKVNGVKFLEFLTIDKDYRDAYEKNIERIGIAVNRTLGASKRNLEIAAPRRNFGTLVSNQMKMIEG